jgi:hypothetical protein
MHLPIDGVGMSEGKGSGTKSHGREEPLGDWEILGEF